MESKRIDAICRTFAISRPIGQPVRIAGAMSNSNWRVHTEARLDELFIAP
jgi:hypothetical protein